MIAQRNLRLIPTNELTDQLCLIWADELLTKAVYQEFVAELETRDIHPEAMAGLVLLGEPEWRLRQIEFA